VQVASNRGADSYTAIKIGNATISDERLPTNKNGKIRKRRNYFKDWCYFQDNSRLLAITNATFK
jgi:hypothetical protein